MFISDFIAGGSGGGSETYPIGALIDFVGVPNFYDNGTTQWMKTGTYVDSTYLSPAIKLNLSSNVNLVAMTKNSLLESYRFLNTVTPAAKNANAICYPMLARTDGTMYSLTVDATGITANSIGATTGYSNYTTYGGTSMITADATRFLNFTAATASTFAVRSSTDGKTWAPITHTGMPAATFANLTNRPMGPSNLTIGAGGIGVTYTTSDANLDTAVFYAGARHILIGPNASLNYVVTRSTDGTTWDGNSTNAVMGSTTNATTSGGWWYNNGALKSFLAMGTAARYTVDGGITWSTAGTFNQGNPIYSQKFMVDTVDPDRIIAAFSATQFQFSNDCGATWTLRTLPFTPTTITRRNGTLLACDGSNAYKSTDGGANWTLVPTPAGLLGTIRGVYSDAYRFYMHATSNQIATSTDAATWTTRNISNPEPTTTKMMGCAALDSSNTIINRGDSNNECMLFTTDGGVTWTWTQKSSSTLATASYTYGFSAAVIGSTKALVSGWIGIVFDNITLDSAAVITAADLAAGGASYRVSTAAITPLRTGAATYGRVA